jgi:hypothetical protein
MKAKTVFGILIILLTNSLPVLSQATAYANIYAEVVAPVGINNTSALHPVEIVFKKIQTTINPTDERTKPVIDLNFSQNGSVTLTSFSITDALHSTFDITLPSEKIRICDDQFNMLIISNFVREQANTGIAQGNKRTITIGADFNFPDNHFNGNTQAKNLFPVTINYN